MGFASFLYLIIYRRIDPLRPLSCFKLHILFLKCLGTWKPETENRIVQALFSLYAFVTRCILVYFFIFTECMFFTEAKDVQTIADATFILTAELAMAYKVLNLVGRFKDIKVFILKVNEELYRVRSPIEEKFMKTAMQRGLLIFVAFLLPATATLSGLAAFPFIDRKVGDELRLPLPAWFPFPVYNTPIFPLIYVYQIIGLIYCAYFDIASDTLIMGVMAIWDAEIKILCHRISQLGYDNGSPNIDNKDVQLYDKDKLVRNQKVRKELIECIYLHQEIVRYFHDFQEIFGNPIFAQVISSVIIVCMTALQMINTPFISAKFFTLVLYLCSMLWQIFIYCWIGNEVLYSSTQLTKSAYLSNFIDFDLRTSKLLILFMERTKRQITIMAGSLFRITLTLQNFMGIMKASYSYLAVLRSVQNE